MKIKNPSKHQKNISIAALSIDLIVKDKKVPSEIQLTPVGFFKAKDGRPVELADGWYIDQAVAEKLIEYNSYSNDRVIDYEHQTLLKEQNGQPAPAAGWFSEFQWRESGLWATNVTWTPTAQQMILDGAYRYISPVIVFDSKTGHVLDVLMAAITNDPAIDGMQNLAKLTAQTFQKLTNQYQEDDQMNLAELLVVLGLPETTTKDDALAALTTLKSELATAQSSIAALTAKVETPDPAKYVPIEVVVDLHAEVASLTAKNNFDAVRSTIVQAVKDNKLRPSQVEWATELGESDMAALTSFLKTATPIAALSNQQADPGNEPPTKQAALTAEQQSVAKCFGMTNKKFLAAHAAEKGDE